MTSPEAMPNAPATTIDALRHAARARRKLRLIYVEMDGSVTEHTLRPLGCFEWRGVMTFGGWSDDHGDFRSLRVDRIGSHATLDETFEEEDGRTMADLLELLEAEMSERDSATDA